MRGEIHSDSAAKYGHALMAGSRWPHGACASRRQFISAIGSLGFAASTGVTAEPLRQQSPHKGKIDVHSHYDWDQLTKFVAVNNPGAPVFAAPWSLDKALEDMDEAGVAKAILSQFIPYGLGNDAQRKTLARELNEAGARLGTERRGRFGLFATLPMTSVDDNLAEIAFALDVLKADGVMMVTSHAGKWLGDPSHIPIYEELNRRRAIVFVHPLTPSCCANLIPAVPEYVIEFGTDTSRAIANLIWSGTTTRFPGIRFIFAHGGGTMPYLIERFLAGTSAEIIPGIVTKGKSPPFVPDQPKQGILTELRRMYYDTAQCSNPVALDALRKVVPVSQILYGSDYWFRSNVETVRGLETSGVFSPTELSAIEYGNARALFG